MEVLINRLQEYQNNLEDALRLEITYDEVKETKDGKKLFKYLRRRHRVINHVVKILKKVQRNEYELYSNIYSVSCI